MLMALTKAMSLWPLSSDELFMQTFLLLVHIQMMPTIKNVCKYREINCKQKVLFNLKQPGEWQPAGWRPWRGSQHCGVCRRGRGWEGRAGRPIRAGWTTWRYWVGLYREYRVSTEVWREYQLQREGRHHKLDKRTITLFKRRYFKRLIRWKHIL